MATLRDLIEQQEETNDRLVNIDNRFLDFFKMLRADKLDMLEMMREIKAVSTPAPALVPSVSETSAAGGMPAFGANTLTGLAIGSLVALPALITGFVEGVFKGVSDLVKRALKLFKIDPSKFTRPFTEMIEKNFGKNSKLFNALDTLITTTYVYFDDYLVKPLTNFRDTTGKLFTKIKNYFDPTGIFSKVFTPITNGFDSISGVFGKIGATFGKFFSGFRAFGTLVGKLFAPFAIVMTALDTYKSTVAAIADEKGGFLDKFIAGFYGFIEGLINSLIMMPLDLLKDGISWIAGKLGFDNFSELLDSFSFQSLFSEMIDGITDAVQQMVRFPFALATGAGAAIMALAPGGESPVEAFNRAYTATMNSGTAPTVQTEATTAAATVTPEEVQAQIGRPRSRASVRREQMERSAAEQAVASGAVTIINNTNAPTSVSTQNSTIDMGSSLPSPTQSNGTRADAYAGA